MHDVGLYGVETCRGQCYRYQTPRNLLIYRGLFGNYERGTDSVCSLLGGNAPLIQDAHLKAEEAGYRVLGVAVQESRGALRSLSESMGLSFPMVLDGDNSVGIAYRNVGKRYETPEPIHRSECAQVVGMCIEYSDCRRLLVELAV